MPTIAIVSGILLVLIGIIGYVFSIVDGNTSLTAMIPAIFGACLIFLGALARGKENLRMHLMHCAVLIGLLGFLVPAWRIVSRIGDIKVSLAILSQAAMSLICLVFVILCVKSFIDARRNRVV